MNWRQHSKKLPRVRSEFGFLDDFLVLHFPLNHILVAKSNDDALAIPHRHHPLLLLVTKPNEQLIIKDISTSQVSTTLWTLLSPVGFSSTNRTSVRMTTCYYTMRYFALQIHPTNVFKKDTLLPWSILWSSLLQKCTPVDRYPRWAHYFCSPSSWWDPPHQKCETFFCNNTGSVNESTQINIFVAKSQLRSR